MEIEIGAFMSDDEEIKKKKRKEQQHSEKKISQSPNVCITKFFVSIGKLNKKEETRAARSCTCAHSREAPYDVKKVL